MEALMLICQHFFFREAVFLRSKLVKVQAVHIVAWQIFQPRVAILGGSKTGPEHFVIHGAAIHGLNAPHGLFVFHESHVHAGCWTVDRVRGVISHCSRYGDLQDFTILPKVILTLQSLFISDAKR